MGRATEELAEHLGHGIGGLLNATFDNAGELIIGLMALSKGLTGVVKASISARGLNRSTIAVPCSSSRPAPSRLTKP
jgi:Ca2+:H+ antiporter